jgi:hypothetical protein
MARPSRNGRAGKEVEGENRSCWRRPVPGCALLRFAPSPRLTAAPACQRQAAISTPREQRGSKKAKRARTLRTRFSARLTPRPESGRGRSEVERRPPPDDAFLRRLFARTPQLQHPASLPRPSHERRPLPDSGRGRTSTDRARDASSFRLAQQTTRPGQPTPQSFPRHG